MTYFVAATWKFSSKGVERAAQLLSSNGSALDAVEQGVRVVEADPEVMSVGLGGYPNMMGESELDAGIMCGNSLATGAVMGIRGFRHPVSIARQVMEKTPHAAVAGSGADMFAYENGFIREPEFNPKAYDRWFEIRDKYMAAGMKFPALDACTDGPYGSTGNIEIDEGLEKSDGDRSHDTVGMVALDRAGNLAAATSTSGLWLKIPGRIGDTPLVGSGFYADNEGGAAVCTGVGEEIMRGCVSHLAVTLMAGGLPAQGAAEQAIQTIHRRLVRARGSHDKVGKMAIVCGDLHGNMGAAANHQGFFMNAAAWNMDPILSEAAVVR